MPKERITCYIREILHSKGLKQDWLATAAQIDPSDLSRIAQGKRNPRVTLARRIAKLLHQPVEVVWPETTPRRRK